MKINNKVKLGIAMFFLFAFIFLLIFHGSLNVTIMNQKVFQIVERFHGNILTNIAKTLSFLGSQYLLIPLFVLLLLFNKKNRKYILPVAITLAVSGILSQLLGFAIGEQRPPYPLVIQGGYSFPSGHSMNNMALYCFLSILIYSHMKDKKRALFYTIPMYLFVILIGISRVYLRVHYFTDILAGFSVGIFIAVVANLLFSRFYWDKQDLLTKKVR